MITEEESWKNSSLPGLWSKRIRLTSLQPGDEIFLARLDTDELVMSHIHKGPLSEQGALRWGSLQVESAIRPQPWRRRWGKWIVKTRGDGVRLGWVELARFRTTRNDYLSVGYQFAPEFWNHGYATEAVRTVASYTLRNLREPYLFAYARPENGASLAVLKKVGFLETKRRIRDDSKRECLVFRISRSQFLPGLASIK